MSGSTSTNNKSKDKFFVANEVSESSFELNEVTSQEYNQQKNNPSFKFSFSNPYCKLNLVMFIPCVTFNL